MKKIMFFLSLACMVIVLTGCKSGKDKAENEIRKLMAEKSCLPYSKMSCWINDTVQSVRPCEKAKMKLVVYIDSTECSECALNKMYMWEDFVRMEKEYKSELFLIFIFQTQRNVKPQRLASLFKITELNHPMYIDDKNVFSKSNPDLPTEDSYHVFLLDEDNRVVLVGSPLFNSKIESLLRKEVEQRIKKLKTYIARSSMSVLLFCCLLVKKVQQNQRKTGACCTG